MLRTIGIVLLAVACTLAGTAAERAQRARLREVRSWCAALGALADELRFRASPLPVLLTVAAEHTDGKAGECLLCLKEELQKVGDWQKVLCKLPDYLPADNPWEVKNALSILGGYGLETQLSALSEAESVLKKQRDILQAELSSKGRIYRAAGLSVGLMLALILW